MTKITKAFAIPVLWLCLFISCSGARTERKGLCSGFYRDSCPQAETIIRETVAKAVSQNPGVAAGLIRTQFHDCFVRGCDASILLDSTPSGKPTEKTSTANFGIRGLEVIDEAKMLLEQACPNIVSCADIIAYAARDATHLSGVPGYKVFGGRRDGRISDADDIALNLPSPNSDVEVMTKIFKEKGLSQDDLVVLLGAHSIGQVHCMFISDHLYNASSAVHLDSFYAEALRRQCPADPIIQQRPGWEQATVKLNPGFEHALDNSFYKNGVFHMVPLQSDQNLFEDEKTRNMVRRYALSHSAWVSRFRKAMVKLGRVDILTKSNEGEIRRSCRAVN